MRKEGPCFECGLQMQYGFSSLRKQWGVMCVWPTSDNALEKRARERDSWLRTWRTPETEPGMTFGRLKRLAADYARAKKDGIETCGKCGGIHREPGC